MKRLVLSLALFSACIFLEWVICRSSSVQADVKSSAFSQASSCNGRKAWWVALSDVHTVLRAEVDKKRILLEVEGRGECHRLLRLQMLFIRNGEPV